VLVAISAHDTLTLELPLKIVAPLFLAELSTARTQKKTSIDETIPNLFSSVRPPDHVAAVPTVPLAPPDPPVSSGAVDPNYYSRKEAEQPEESSPALNKNGAPGTAFLKRYATPNDIVSKAAALGGVEGALIALPDGLLVASHVGPAADADTIAAFLPQIFNRLNQCTRELRQGELNNLSFTLGNVPWKVFRVGAIYFAAFGRAGEPLPTAQLAGMAADLDRKAK
jgi:predicted regulator of Ras-like GTPase activity (Roadblock/LC7/MglB family)